MTVVMPETVKSQGNKILIVLTEPPAAPAAPTLAELNGGLFVQCHLYGDFSGTPNQNVGEGPRKMCSRIVPQQLGNVTYQIADVQYSYVPQAMGTPGAPGNEAIEALAPGTDVYVYEGPGIDGTTGAVATGDVLNGYHLDCGEQRRGQTGDGEFDEFSVTQSFVMANGEEPQFDYVVPAA
jgi:hypothetical protein